MIKGYNTARVDHNSPTLELPHISVQVWMIQVTTQLAATCKPLDFLRVTTFASSHSSIQIQNRAACYFHPKRAGRSHLGAVHGRYQFIKRLPATDDREYQYEIRSAFRKDGSKATIRCNRRRVDAPPLMVNVAVVCRSRRTPFRRALPHQQAASRIEPC
jgi:hypothetical protein